MVGVGLPEAARWIERERALDPGTVFVTIHIADYDRLQLYAAPSARASIVQVQIDRYTLPPRVMIERVRALLATRRRVRLVAGSEGRFNQRWREAFPSASRLTAFPKPGGADAVVVWELRR